jgi:putative lipoprotein
MKRAIQRFVIVVMSCALCGCGTLSRPDDPWWGKDKAMHFGAGAALGAGSTWVALDRGAGDGEAVALGLCVGVAFGAGKETYDQYVKRTHWSGKDFLWTTLGSLGGSLLVSLATE